MIVECDVGYLDDEGHRVVPRPLEAEGGEIEQMVAPSFTQGGVGKGWGEALPKGMRNRGKDG